MPDPAIGPERMDLLLVERDAIVVARLDDHLALSVHQAGQGEGLLLAVAEHPPEQLDDVVVGVLVVIEQDQVVARREL